MENQIQTERVTLTSPKTSPGQWPEDWETRSISDEQFALIMLTHWSVPNDMAIQYIEIFGWKKAADLSMEASIEYTDHGLHNPRAYVRSLVKDELLIPKHGETRGTQKGR